jgi:septal ring factor EnvC (AmiA/AmiB activator)
LAQINRSILAASAACKNARWLLFLTVLFFAGSAPADDREKQLARVRERLQSLQADLNKTKTQRESVREEISDLERKIGVSLNQLRTTEKRLALEERRLNALREKQAAQRRHLDEQREGLARHARAQYAAGRQEHLKLLLMQQDPNTVSRTLVYYRYIYQERSERIASIQTALVKARELEENVQTKQQELLGLRESQQRAKTELETNRARRGTLLASLDRRMATQSRQIDHLREDETRLTRLLKEITTAYADIPMPRDLKGAFGTLKGKLALPAKGQLAARYGDPKTVGNLKWRGLFLNAAEGTAVRAVARGRVAYADWLRGFGLLLILEHGDGYMTLYGHNQSLHKQAGEWVDAGDAIARVGNTGDVSQPGLYFEIRHIGEPRDPLLWCRTR